MAVRQIPTLERYFARQIYGTVGFVLLSFLALFAFFDLIKELADLGTGEYNLGQVFTFVLLSVPTNAYELLPVAVLIGTLYVLAHLANNSEYTVMRGSGLSPGRAALALAKIGLAFVVLTFVIGEWVAPHAEEQAQKVKLRAMSSVIGQDLQSGLWFKDEGAFINVREARQANSLTGVRIFDFDADYRLRRMTVAQRAEYQSGGRWRLVDVVQTEFTRDGPRTARLPEQEWRSAVNPEMLDALIVRPERMSAWALHKYTQHLAGNRQKTERYEIRLHDGARRGGRGEGLPRHHARHLLPHAEQPVLAHRPAAELAAVLRRRSPERRLPRRSPAHDVVGGAKVMEPAIPENGDSHHLRVWTRTRRVPARRSWRNCRSRSNSAQTIEIPVGTRTTASRKRSSALPGVTPTRRTRQVFMASVWPPRSQLHRK
jgi:lipopolysaccharide export system permease protein